jgi:hypothetical protein
LADAGAEALPHHHQGETSCPTCEGSNPSPTTTCGEACGALPQNGISRQFFDMFCHFFFWGGHPKQPKSNWICVKRFQSLNMFKHENKLRKQHTYLRNLTFRSESKDAERVGMSLSTGMGSQSFMDFTLNTLYERTLLWVFGCF